MEAVKVAALALLICAAGPVRAEESSLLPLAPAGSDVLIGVNCKRFFGAFPAPGSARGRALLDAMGLRSFGDLDEALIALSSSQPGKLVSLMRGRFDASRLAQTSSARAILDPSLLVQGDEAAVREFVARRGRGPAFHGPVAVKAAEMSRENDLWVLAEAPLSAILPQGTNPGVVGRLIETVQRASLGVKFGTEIVLSARAETHSEGEAQWLASAMRFACGMAATSRADGKQLAALMDKIKIGVEGRTATVSLVASKAEVDEILGDRADESIQALLGIGIVSAPADLRLKVEAKEGQLILTWNGNGSIVSTATRASLRIVDGDHTEDVDLDLPTVRSGTIVYSRISDLVSFRLEVVDQKTGKREVESVHWPN